MNKWRDTSLLTLKWEWHFQPLMKVWPRIIMKSLQQAPRKITLSVQVRILLKKALIKLYTFLKQKST
jgi:hypothetical protein